MDTVFEQGSGAVEECLQFERDLSFASAHELDRLHQLFNIELFIVAVEQYLIAVKQQLKTFLIF